MTDDELRKRLDKLQEWVEATKREASYKGNLITWIALYLLLVKSCAPQT